MRIPVPARDTQEEPLPPQGFTSEEGLVVTSKGSFFRSAWERMGVVFCRVNRMRRWFMYLVLRSQLFLEPPLSGTVGK